MPSVAAKTVQFSYSESFDDGILNSSPWSFGGTHGRPGWGTVTEHNGFLDIQNAVTDNGGKATVAFQTGVSNAVISMDRYYHAANSYYFGDTVMSFTSATGANVIVALRMQKSSWAPDYESNPNNFNRPKLIVDDQIGTSVFTYGTISSSSLYNQWINTDISIDNLTGAVSIDLNSDGITDISIISAALVGAKLDSIDFNSYGWYTGHYSYLDNLTVNGTTTLPTLRTADSIFKTEGELAFLSRLALAAYSLNLFENTGLAINNGDGPNGPSTLAFSGLGSFLRLLTPTELRGTGLHYANPTSFGLNGLHNGIFTTRNAAALVAQSKDALFVSFRGTNDNAGVSLPSLSPDQQDWVHQPLHYSQFNRLFDAISLWLAANPLITTIYVTGHSLGASMAQAFSQDPRFAGMNIEATAFASPEIGRAHV